MPTNDRRSPMIDWKMPVTWLIATFLLLLSGTMGLGVSIANNTNKLDKVVDSQNQIIATQKENASKVDTLRDRVAETKQAQALMEMRVTALERIPPRDSK